MTSQGRQYPDGPLEAPPDWPGDGTADPAIIEDLLFGEVFYEVERAPDGTPVSVRHLPREQALGSFLTADAPRPIPIKRRDPEEIRARLLNGPLPPDLAAALADEIGPET